MINLHKIGIVYHVVDKDTGEIIKVGSTTKTLKFRFGQADYKKKYKNHFLRAIRIIESSDHDWYQPKNRMCPFLWHLVAIEHIEMIKAGTFQKGRLSNQISPLLQKAFGLDGVVGGSIGGKIGGKTTAEKYFTKEHQSRVGRLGGIIVGNRLAESGQFLKIRTPEGCRKGGITSGNKNKENGHIARIGKKFGPKQGRLNVESGFLLSITSSGGKKGGPIAMHNRWHIKRGIVSENCALCKGI